MIAPTRRVVIVGCGRQGAYLAVRMVRAGWNVAVVDRKAAAFGLLPENMHRARVVGEVFRLETLGRARISGAHALIATTGEDQRNVLIASIARRFGVRRAIARVRDSDLGPLECLGIEIVCPTLLEATAILDRLPLLERSSTERGLYVVIAGAGRLGLHLARTLTEMGCPPVVIERNAMTLDRLRTSGFAGTLVEGDAAEPSVLRRASVTKATVVVSAVREDRENLMVSLVAQKLVGAREVLARASDPERAAMYHDLGLTVICPTVIGGEAILDLAGVERVRAGSAG